MADPKDPLDSGIAREPDFDPDSEEGKHLINMMIVALVVQKHGEETGEVKYGNPVKQLEVEFPDDLPPEGCDTSMLEIQIEGRKARIRVVFFKDDREGHEVEQLKAAFANVRQR